MQHNDTLYTKLLNYIKLTLQRGNQCLDVSGDLKLRKELKW